MKKTPKPPGSDEPVIVKKVRPFPFPCYIVRAEGQPAIACQALKLTEVGMMIKTNHQLIKVGDQFMLNFELPTISRQINEGMKVIKIYHSFDNTFGGMEKVFTVEVHFRSLGPDAKAQIRSFLNKIGQK